MAAQASLSEIVLPDLPDIAGLLARTLDDIAEDAEAQVTAHLATHPAPGEAWLATGAAHADQACPFCGQNIGGAALVAALRAVFSDGYRALKNDIANLQRLVNERVGEPVAARCETLLESNRGAAQFWTQYCAFDPADVAAPAGVVEAMRGSGPPPAHSSSKKPLRHSKSLSRIRPLTTPWPPIRKRALGPRQ